MYNKRFLTFLILWIAAIGYSFAAAFTENGIEYNYKDIVIDGVYERCVTVSGCTSSSANIIIPERTSGGYRVIGIEANAFLSKTSIQSISLPSGIKYNGIGNLAFSGCTKLKKVTFSSLEDLLEITFASPASHPLYHGGDLCFNGDETPVTTVVIPKGVTEIKPFAFYGCKSIKSLTIANTVATLGASALSNTDLYTLIIGTNITYLPRTDVHPKKTIYLANTPPTNCEYFSGEVNYVASDKYDLLNQYVYANLSSMFVVNGIRYVPVTNTASSRTCDVIDCIYSPNEYELNIPQTIKKTATSTYSYDVLEVRPYACFGNIYFHNGATIENKGNIGSYAFSEINNIGDAEITNQGNIEDDAFYKSGLKITNIKNVGNIGKDAFANSSISTLVVSNQGNISGRAFYYCGKIISATIENTGDIMGSAFAHSFSEEQPSSVVINNQSGNIGESAFSGCKFTNLTIGENARIFGKSVFSDCDNITTASIPDCVNQMGDMSFYGCGNLSTVTIGSGLSIISKEMFAFCPSIEEMIFPSTLTSVERGAFNNCTGLTNVVFNDIETTIAIDCSYIDDYGKPKGNIFNNSPLKYAYIGRPMSFSVSPFASKDQLAKVVIGDKADAVYDGEFAEDISLTDLTIGKGVQFIGSQGFKNCRSLAKVVLNDAVKEVRNESFSGCSSLPEIKIPAATTLIGNSVFSGCTSLKTFVIENSNNSVSIGYGYKQYSGKLPQFKDCPLDSVYIGKKIQYTSTEDCYSPFYFNLSLRAVHIAENEEEVYQYEFYRCRGLKNVYLGDNVKTINKWAFSNCTGLDYIEIGENVKNLNYQCFADDQDVSKVVCHALTPPTCEEGAIDDIPDIISLYVPAGCQKLYLEDDSWFRFCDNIYSLTPKITLNYKTLELRPFEKETLVVTSGTSSGESFTWSSNNSIINVNASTGEIFPIQPGTAVITCTSSNADVEPVTCTVTVPEFVTPDVDTDGFYMLATAEDLYWLQYQVNQKSKSNISAKLVNDITINENVLTSTGDLNGTPRRVWFGIGGWGNYNSFQGEFDGQGFSVRGLYFDNSPSLFKYKGLFGRVLDAAIKNISIKDSYFGTGAKGYVGAICGYADESSIEGCSNESTVECENNAYGGIVGYAIDSYVFNCQNFGKIGVSASNTRSGGIVGYSDCSTITNCLNQAVVSGDYSGGICGYAKGTMSIENCLNVGTVVSVNNGAGAIIGYKYDDNVQVHSCYYDSDICKGVYTDKELTTGFATSNFADGNIAYALNGECDDYDSNTLYWYQTIGSDVYPVLDMTHNQVKDPSTTTRTITIDDSLDEFSNTIAKNYSQITYTRNFKNTGWQELYVPFAMSYDDWKNDFEVGYIEGFLSRDLDNDGTIDETTWSGVKITEGTLLPNTPYIIRAKTTGNKSITLNNATLYATESNSIDCSSTTMKYIFTGHYDSVDFDNADDYPYYLNNGSFKFISGTFPFRWTLRFESRGTSFIIHPNITRGFVRENDGTPFEEYVENHQEMFSGYKIFTLDGQMIDLTSGTLSPGFYIKNNKKVLVK